MKISRRKVLLGLGMGVSGAAMAYGLRNVFGHTRYTQTYNTQNLSDAGTNNPSFELPVTLAAGFGLHMIEQQGQPMNDGQPVPEHPDGMGCFLAEDGNWILMRNHEIPEAKGGVTRVVIDPTTLKRVHSQWVLRGTDFNCAGGLSPWGWLSCEESDVPGHGYVYACPITDQKPWKISAYGQFRHEAAAVDPRTMMAYMTEDRPDSCFYRFAPTDPKTPFMGQLQAMVLSTGPSATSSVKTASGFERGKQWKVNWVNVGDLQIVDDFALRERAQQRKAAVFARGEGLWWTEDAVFFTATAGGPAKKGQVFKLSLNDEKNQTLELWAQGEDNNVLDMPDNLTVAPDGTVYLAEDGYGLLDKEDCIRMLGPDKHIHTLLRCKNSEIAGLCFSPDGRVLFANLQAHGVTVAIQGPFSHLS